MAIYPKQIQRIKARIAELETTLAQLSLAKITLNKGFVSGNMRSGFNLKFGNDNSPIVQFYSYGWGYSPYSGGAIDFNNPLQQTAQCFLEDISGPHQLLVPHRGQSCDDDLYIECASAGIYQNLYNSSFSSTRAAGNLLISDIDKDDKVAITLLDYAPNYWGGTFSLTWSTK